MFRRVNWRLVIAGVWPQLCEVRGPVGKGDNMADITAARVAGTVPHETITVLALLRGKASP